MNPKRLSHRWLAGLAISISLSAAPAHAGTPPTYADFSAYADQLSSTYKVPAVVIKAIMEQESGWTQFTDSQGTVPLISGDGGIGIMQVTPPVALGMIDNTRSDGENSFTVVPDNTTAVSTDQLKSDWRYNMQIGVQVLLRKVLESESDYLDLNILENWYYPIAYYNGGASYNGSNSDSNDPINPAYSRNPSTNAGWKSKSFFPYQECVFNIIAQKYTIPSARQPYFGSPVQGILPGPSAVQSGAGQYTYLDSGFRFQNYAEFHPDGTAKTGTSASPKTYTNVPIHTIAFGAIGSSTSAVISAVSPVSIALNAGESFPVTYSISAGGPRAVLLGASLFPAGQTAGEIDDPSDDTTANLSAGQNSAQRQFTVPLGTPSGTYDLVVALWDDLNGDGRIDSGDNEITYSKVSGAVTVSAGSGCSYSLSPGRFDMTTSGGAASSFNVATGSACDWNAFPSDPSWIAISSNGSGPGSKLVTFSVQSNTGSSARTGTITVQDQTFTITQPGSTAGNQSVSVANILVAPPSYLPGYSVTIYADVTSPISQNVLLGASIFPSGTNTEYDDPADDVPVTLAARTLQYHHVFALPNSQPPGTYDVAFAVWADTNNNGIIDAGDTQLGSFTAYGALTVRPPVGAIQVTLSPAGAISAGAQWRADGGNWFNSGDQYVALAVGNHTVNFKTISGWTTPADQIVPVTTNQTTQATGTYVVAPTTYTLSVTAANGTVSVNPAQATYTAGTSVTLTPTPNAGYLFDSWSGDASGSVHPLTITMDANKNIIANFTQGQGTVNLVANPSNGGTVSGGGTFAVGSAQTITATANTNWTFTGWSDGNPQATRTVTVVSGSTTYTANFSQGQGTVNLVANPSNGGTVSGGGTFAVGSAQTITATPNATWTFTGWSDGNPQATRTVTVVSGSTTYTANFTQGQGTVNLLANPSNGGTVSGGGTFAVGSAQTITATPSATWTFTGWSDGNPQATRTVAVVNGSTTYTANFTQGQGTVNLIANPSNGGTVTGGGTFAVGSAQTITATPNSGWTFTGWNDGNAQATRTVTVASADTTYTASFSQNPATLSVTANPAEGGTVTGGGTFAVGSSQTISATPNSGWTLTGWNDGNTQATRTVTVASAGSTYTANFTLPSVSLTTTPLSTVTLGSGDVGEVLVTLSSAQSNDLFIHYTIKGSAINGTDYVLLSGSKKIKAGKTSKPIKVIPLGDLGGSSKKTVKITLAPGDGYTIGTPSPVKVKILAGP